MSNETKETKEIQPIFSLIHGEDAEWWPFCSVCNKPIKTMSIKEEYEEVLSDLYCVELRHTGFREFTFECHGKRIWFRVHWSSGRIVQTREL